MAREDGDPQALWTFEQALAWIVDRDPAKAREAPELLTSDNFSPAIREAFWLLWASIEGGVVRVVEHLHEVAPHVWRGMRPELEQLDELKIGPEPFLHTARRATRHTLITVADLMNAFPALAATGPEMPLVSPPPHRECEEVASPPVEQAASRTKPQIIASLLHEDYPAGRPQLDVLTMERKFRGRHPEVSFEHSSDSAKPARTFQAALAYLGWTKKR
jgi:hypothetical protein